MRKRFVLSGYLGFKNFGDEAILSVLVKKLKQEKATVTVISSNPKYTKSLYPHIISIKTFNFFDIIGALNKSNYLISGGGSLLQDTTSLKSLLYYLSIIFLAKFLRKKVIIFAQGIGPISNPAGKFLTKIALKNCAYISVRDQKSKDLLSSWGINSDLVCDPIFDIKIPAAKKNKTIGIQLRNFKTINADFIQRLAEAVYDNFKEYDVEIFSLQDSIDLEICKRFEKELNMLCVDKKITVHSALSTTEVIDKISKLEYLISMRFHSIIAGLLTGCKTMAINYDIKIDKIAKEFNLPMIELNKPFHNQFNKLKQQNIEEIKNILENKNFNWNGFEQTIH